MLIGVYRNKNPLATLPPQRIQALVREAANQGVELVFFAADGIDVEGGCIWGTVPGDGERINSRYPLPDVVLNERPGKPSLRPPVELQLRERVPFTAYSIYNKLDLYRKLQPAYGRYLLPQEEAVSVEGLLAFVRQYGDVILKPVHGRSNRDRVRIRPAAGGYHMLQDGQEEQAISLAHLEDRLGLLLEGRKYMMQQYWPVDEQGEPAAYRVHVQRDESGRWQITVMYPRTAGRGAAVSGMSKGGATMDMDEELNRLYPGRSELLKRQLGDVALQLAAAIDDFYHYMIDELGMDLLMNGAGEIRFLEASSGPEARYYEDLRAVHTIGFAKYVARAFQHRKLNEGPVIGMMVRNMREEWKLRESCAYVAKDCGAGFYCFRVRDVRFELPVVKGYRLHNGQWEPHYVPYPDIVYDRVKERGGVKYAEAYRKLGGIPFTEKRKGGVASKLKQYRLFAASPAISAHVIPYLKMDDWRAALQFLESRHAAVIKPSIGTLGRSVMYVERTGNGYTITDHKHIQRLARNEMEQLLASLASKRGYIIQQFVSSETKAGLPHYVRVHLVKDREGQWQGVEPIMYVSVDPNGNKVNHLDTFWVYTPLARMLKHEFPERKQDIPSQLNTLATAIAETLERAGGVRLCEIGIDFGIDRQGHIWIFEANLNRVGVDYKELEIAKLMIPAALEQIGRS